MSMPDELSQYIHNFLRGPSKSGETRGRHAKEQWLYRNSVKGFKVGQVFKGNFEKLYTVIKVGAMVTFECEGKQIRRKPIFVKSRFHRDDDSRNDYWSQSYWYVTLDKASDEMIGLNESIYSPVPVEIPVRVVKKVPKKMPMPEPESDDEDDVPFATLLARMKK